MGVLFKIIIGILRLANDFISLSGVKTNNLKGIAVTIPQHKFTCVTGASGSGKTSLVFDTLHQEARRRFLTTLSRQESQHIQPQCHAQLDRAENLPASIAIKQQRGKPDLRSTLGTLTHINEYLRLLFCQVSARHCYDCQTPLYAYDYSQLTKEIIQRYQDKDIHIAAPLQRTNVEYAMLVEQGFDRFVNVQTPHQLLAQDAIQPDKIRELAVLISRVQANSKYANRIQDAVRTSYQIAKGCVLVGVDGGAQMFSRNYECFACGTTSGVPTPAYFSYFHPLGACLSCGGVGCAECQYERLQKPHRAYQIKDKTFPALLQMNAPELQHWLAEVSANTGAIDDIIAELQQRLDYICRLKLDYISCARPAVSMSWGELQRAKIAACLGTELIDMLYCFDEPTTGLHANDSVQLHELLQTLCDRQNTVVAIEHDQYFIRNADHLIVLGEGAGKQGGKVVYTGAPSAYRPVSIAFKTRKTTSPKHNFIHLQGIETHNLRNITVQIPLQRLTCVCGVSGSGKSSLIQHTLYPLLRKKRKSHTVACREFNCDAEISDAIMLGQNMGHVSSRANAATFIGTYSQIRQLFAKTAQAQRRGFTQACFSFNTQQGQCPACKGLGFFEHDYASFGIVREQCHLCAGQQFRSEVLQVKMRGLNIKEVLDLSLQDALSFFQHQQDIKVVLAKGIAVGLGYLTLGQPLNTLSNGEFQRLRLLKMLLHEQRSMVLIFDEPSVGLADNDVALFLQQIDKILCDSEHTVIIVDHHIEILKFADWLIELGEGAGADGGKVLYCGDRRGFLQAQTNTAKLLLA